MPAFNYLIIDYFDYKAFILAFIIKLSKYKPSIVFQRLKKLCWKEINNQALKDVIKKHIHIYKRMPLKRNLYLRLQALFLTFRETSNRI